MKEIKQEGNIRTLDGVLLEDVELNILKKLINSSYEKYKPKKQKK